MPRDGSRSRTRSIASSLGARGGARRVFGRHARALLAPGGDRAGISSTPRRHKKRKELRRQRRRLADRAR